MDNIVIKKAAPKDLEAFVELECKGFKEDRFTSAQIKYLITKAKGVVLKLEYNMRIAGYAIVIWRKNNNTARLYNIVIDPEFQGKGFGVKLLNACETAAVKNKKNKLSLEVRVDNVNAVNFYKSHGYDITKRLHGYYSRNKPGYKMVKDLNI